MWRKGKNLLEKFQLTKPFPGDQFVRYSSTDGTRFFSQNFDDGLKNTTCWYKAAEQHSPTTFCKRIHYYSCQTTDCVSAYFFYLQSVEKLNGLWRVLYHNNSDFRKRQWFQEKSTVFRYLHQMLCGCLFRSRRQPPWPGRVPPFLDLEHLSLALFPARINNRYLVVEHMLKLNHIWACWLPRILACWLKRASTTWKMCFTLRLQTLVEIWTRGENISRNKLNFLGNSSENINLNKISENCVSTAINTLQKLKNFRNSL